MGGKGGGGGDSASNQANKLLQEQIDIQKQQERQKQKALAEQEMNIIKSQGTMNWSSAAPTGIDPNDKDS